MTGLELVADLRNKLTPAKNYFAMAREKDSLELRLKDKDGVISLSTQIKIEKLTEFMERERIQAETSMAKAEMIMELLGNELEKNEKQNGSNRN